MNNMFKFLKAVGNFSKSFHYNTNNKNTAKIGRKN